MGLKTYKCPSHGKIGRILQNSVVYCDQCKKWFNDKSEYVNPDTKKRIDK